MKSAPGIAFEYKPSRLIAAAGGVMIALSLVGIAASGLPLALKLVASLFFFLYGAYSLRCHLASNIVRIAHGASGWLLVDRDRREWIVSLTDHVHRGTLLVLSFVGEGIVRQRFVLLADNIDLETRRRLLLVLAAGDGKSQQ